MTECMFTLHASVSRAEGIFKVQTHKGLLLSEDLISVPLGLSELLHKSNCGDLSRVERISGVPGGKKPKILLDCHGNVQEKVICLVNLSVIQELSPKTHRTYNTAVRSDINKSMPFRI